MEVIMQLLVTKVARTKRQLEAFEGRVNEFLKDGWKVKEVVMQNRLFRTVCYAILEK